MNVRIGDIRWNTEAEGPGIRTAIWTQGCTLRCGGCCNPELIPLRGGTQWDPSALARTAAAESNQGITLLGGEPLDQAPAVRQLLHEYRHATRANAAATVWLFSGYTWERIAASRELQQTVALCDVVIAGPFDATQTPDSRKWIGSRNQTVHILTDRHHELKTNWPANQYEIELTVRDGEILINGWPLV